MLTMADLIAVLSLCLTSFGLGYANLWLHAWQKNNRPLA